MKPHILTVIALAFSIGGAFAQDHTAPDLPAICLKDVGHGGMAMPMGATGDDAHLALMSGMDRMNADMMAGATAQDLDVAFVCSMIPHHRGAIDMAKAELQYGDDEWARGLAQQIIAAQEKEIADMLGWLEGQ